MLFFNIINSMPSSFLKNLHYLFTDFSQISLQSYSLFSSTQNHYPSQHVLLSYFKNSICKFLHLQLCLHYCSTPAVRKWSPWAKFVNFCKWKFFHLQNAYFCKWILQFNQLIHLRMVYDCFEQQKQWQVAMTEIIWPIKPEV